MPFSFLHKTKLSYIKLSNFVFQIILELTFKVLTSFNPMILFLAFLVVVGSRGGVVVCGGGHIILMYVTLQGS